MKYRIDAGETAAAMGRRLFTQEGFSCSEAVLCAMAAWWGIDEPGIPRIATPFRGGICGAQLGICGALSGGLMAIGLRLGRDSADQDASACVQAGKSFLKEVSDEGALDCRTITGKDFSDPEQYQVFHDEIRGDVCAGLIERCCQWLAQNIK